MGVFVHSNPGEDSPSLMMLNPTAVSLGAGKTGGSRSGEPPSIPDTRQGLLKASGRGLGVKVMAGVARVCEGPEPWRLLAWVGVGLTPRLSHASLLLPEIRGAQECLRGAGRQAGAALGAGVGARGQS